MRPQPQGKIPIPTTLIAPLQLPLKIGEEMNVGSVKYDLPMSLSTVSPHTSENKNISWMYSQRPSWREAGHQAGASNSQLKRGLENSEIMGPLLRSVQVLGGT